MKILHVIDTLDPEHGGPTLVVSRLAAAQSALGHTVTILTRPAEHATERIEGLFSSIPCGETVSRISTPERRGIGRLVAERLPPDVCSMIDAQDFAHLHGVWDGILTSASRRCRTSNVPYAVAPHGMLNPWSLRQRSLKKKIALALGRRAMLNNAAFYHVLNEDEERPTREVGLRAPTKVIPNGIFLEELESKGTSADSGTQYTQPYILFLSRLHPGKGADLLIDAYATIADEFPDMQLVVAGPDAGARSDSERRIEAHNLQTRVSMPGAVWGDDKIALMKNAACFCLPSQHEGFSVAITEAMAFGLPVVISEECHFPEVKEVGAGVIVALETDEIAAGLRRVLSDDKNRRAMGDAGRELILSKYTWPKIAERTIEIYGTYAS